MSIFPVAYDNNVDIISYGVNSSFVTTILSNYSSVANRSSAPTGSPVYAPSKPYPSSPVYAPSYPYPSSPVYAPSYPYPSSPVYAPSYPYSSSPVYAPTAYPVSGSGNSGSTSSYTTRNTELAKEAEAKNKVIIGTVVGVGGFLLILLIVAVIRCRRRR
jgi:hypothetical protein